MNFKHLFFVLIAVAFSSSSAFGQVVGMDDFDGGELFVTRTFTPDLSGNLIPGTFPGSNLDVFGIVDRTVNFTFSDDTLMDPMFTGMFPTTVTDSFLGHQDLVNDENPSGTAQVVYVFDIAGATDLAFSIDIASFGDFELSDINIITASIDGGAAETLIELIAQEDEENFLYTFEDGSEGAQDDPLGITDPTTGEVTFISNFFQTLSAPITGSGSELTITFDLAGNGGTEVVAYNNLLIEGGVSKFAPGDVNCDGVVDLLDVAPFVEAILDPAFQPKADVDGDGADDLLDVAPFVALILG